MAPWGAQIPGEFPVYDIHWARAFAGCQLPGPRSHADGGGGPERDPRPRWGPLALRAPRRWLGGGGGGAPCPESPQAPVRSPSSRRGPGRTSLPCTPPPPPSHSLPRPLSSSLLGQPPRRPAVPAPPGAPRARDHPSLSDGSGRGRPGVPSSCHAPALSPGPDPQEQLRESSAANPSSPRACAPLPTCAHTVPRAPGHAPALGPRPGSTGSGSPTEPSPPSPGGFPCAGAGLRGAQAAIAPPPTHAFVPPLDGGDGGSAPPRSLPLRPCCGTTVPTAKGPITPSARPLPGGSLAAGAQPSSQTPPRARLLGPERA